MAKLTKWHVCPVKTQISLGICPAWSESSPSAWRKLGSLAQSEDCDQTGWMPRLIWVFAGRTSHFFGFVTMRLITHYTGMLRSYYQSTTLPTLKNPLPPHPPPPPARRPTRTLLLKSIKHANFDVTMMFVIIVLWNQLPHHIPVLHVWTASGRG